MTEKSQSELVFRYHDRGGMIRQKDELIAVYAEVYEDRIRESFFLPARFWERLESYAARDGFSLVAGRIGLALIGYTIGFTLPPKSSWWNGIQGDIDGSMLVEDGKRTFAVAELMVRKKWRRLGYARALNAALLQNRQEKRATLLVRPENLPARAAYRSWGWRKFGDPQPFEDAPVYEVMLLDLRSR